MVEGLSKDELRVLELWAVGYNQAEAYKRVMLSKYELNRISDAALKKRVNRFFGNLRLREAMAQYKGRRGNKARKDIENYNERKKDIEPPETKTKAKKETKPKETHEEQPTKTSCNDAHDWLESLQISKDPTALSIYGTGLFVLQIAVSQIQRRYEEIQKLGLSPFEKDASPYTALDLQAIRTAASMIMPFAPPPTNAERKAMALAGVLVGLTEAEIKEDPDAYTAPPPASVVDVENE